MQVIPLDIIQSKLDLDTAIKQQEEAFRLYSEGKAQVPPVGYMNFGKEIGDVHIKYGWIEGEDHFVVKIAGAYKQSPSSSQGMMVVLDVRTGQPVAILQDEGYLTNIRTAIAGLIAAKHLAPKNIRGIGIIGTGTQAKLQAELLMRFTDCRKLWVWGRNRQKAEDYREEISKIGFDVKIAQSSAEICQECNLIVTTTPSNEAIIKAEDVKPGTHITAVGADSPGKQELERVVLTIADLVVVDSKSQAIDHGECVELTEDDVVELGEVVGGKAKGRTSDEQVTVCDLTGLGVQDVAIAKGMVG